MKGLRAVQAALLALGLAGASWASAQPTDLIISEYVEGTSNNKAIEIYNGTGASVDLSGYSIRLATNGSTTLGNAVNLSGSLASGDVFVIVNTSAAQALRDLADLQNSTATGFNGDDAVLLFKTGGVLVDAFGQVGFDPGTGWGSGDTFTADRTLRRKGTVCAGDTDSSDAFEPSNEWDGFATDTFTGLGSHSVECPSATPELSVADVSQFEGNAGPVNFEFTVSLSAPAPAGGVQFDFITSDITAQALPGGNDYSPRIETGVTIAEGQSSITVNVIVQGDTVDEADETFRVTLSNPVGATLGDAEAIGTIRNDDASTATLNIVAPADIGEGASGTTNQNFTVSLSAPLAEAVEFTATTSDISATAGQDYVALASAPFSIAAGQTSVDVPVQIIGDRTDESNEAYRVTIATSSMAVTLGTSQAEGVILDDDLPFTEIFNIQGSGVCSPFVAVCNPSANVAGDPVRSQNNVVTAIGASGFTMQTPDARDDQNPLTSNGIYVFTAGAPRNDAGELLAVGDAVEVIGQAAEFFSLTQIVVASTRDGANSILVQSSGNELPPTVFFGNAARALGQAIPSKDPDALSCGALGNFECFEGMRVRMDNAAVTVANQRFSGAGQQYAEVWISPYGERGLREKGARFGSTLTPANAAAGVWDGNPEILEMDADFLIPGLLDTELAGGTRFSAIGVIGFDFGDYEFWPSSLTVVEGTNEVVRPVPAPATGELTIGSFNAFRFCDALANSPSNCAATTALETNTARVEHQLGQVSAYIREVLRSPDVVGLQEVENLAILQELAAQIVDDGGPTYEAYLVEGNDVGGIDVGYLVNTARITNAVVTQLAATETWNDPSGSPTAILHDRPPLLLQATFTGNGRPFDFQVINNHTRSRGGVDVSDPDGERVRAKRFLQAVSIANLVQELQTDAATAEVPLFVIGDHNAYQFTDGYVDVVGLIAGTYSNEENTCAPANAVTNCELDGGSNIVSPALVNAVDVIDPAERYSYKFTENFGAIQGSTGRDVATNQVLDHGLFNSVASPFVTGMAYGRANVDASAQRFRVCNFTNRDLNLCPQGPIANPPQPWVPTGSSDHDGFVIFVSPPLPDAIFANGFETID
ncbi:lamin tail domain-containing protein [Aquimonas voraii]|uniref:Calx-beta domain-containing protein n=1 Tax=Aquimonas voraii TaxID=265719 RepID=A0A1G6S0I3_9GAMM|nr:lamin tail domain-containing protein [Aquimonas voraii]SDD10369.1 Calx-beta domain-containing protein [Aquimonas voraii]